MQCAIEPRRVFAEGGFDIHARGDPRHAADFHFEPKLLPAHEACIHALTMERTHEFRAETRVLPRKLGLRVGDETRQLGKRHRPVPKRKPQRTGGALHFIGVVHQFLARIEDEGKRRKPPGVRRQRPPDTAAHRKCPFDGQNVIQGVERIILRHPARADVVCLDRVGEEGRAFAIFNGRSGNTRQTTRVLLKQSNSLASRRAHPKSPENFTITSVAPIEKQGAILRTFRSRVVNTESNASALAAGYCPSVLRQLGCCLYERP